MEIFTRVNNFVKNWATLYLISEIVSLLSFQLFKKRFKYG
jgi:hypothetical protein